MNRVVGIMTAFLVLLLLASGFMAADNVRLSGEYAALNEEHAKLSYDYAVAKRQMQNIKEENGTLLLQREELIRQLQDYQPGFALELNESNADPAQSPTPIPETTPEDSPLDTPRPAEDLSLTHPGNNDGITPAPSDAPTVTEDIFSQPAADKKPAASAAPAFQTPLNDTALLHKELKQLQAELSLLRQRLEEVESSLLRLRTEEQTPGDSLVPPRATPVPSAGADRVTPSPETTADPFWLLTDLFPPKEDWTEFLRHALEQNAE